MDYRWLLLEPDCTPHLRRLRRRCHPNDMRRTDFPPISLLRSSNRLVYERRMGNVAPVLDTFMGAGMPSVDRLGRHDAGVMVAAGWEDQYLRPLPEYCTPRFGVFWNRLDQG